MENQSDIVDARGLACPQPVIITRRALATVNRSEVTAVVDNDVARDNIVKMATDLSCDVDIDRHGSDYYIHITKPEHFSTELELRQEIAFLIGSDSLGRGSEELGQLLMRNFFYALAEEGSAGKVLLFLNGGVRLTCSGSPILDYLYQLEQDGAQVYSCGTCLDFYKLRDQLGVGQITNMYTILEYLEKTPRIIYL